MLVAILITCAQSFSNENHEVNCGRAIRARAASSCTYQTKRSKRSSHSFKLSGAVILEVFPMGKSLGLGWSLSYLRSYSCDKFPKGKKKLEPRFVGNIVVDIEGLARVIKPLILRLKRKALTCLGPESALGDGWGGGGEEENVGENQIVERAERYLVCYTAVFKNGCVAD